MAWKDIPMAMLEAFLRKLDVFTRLSCGFVRQYWRSLLDDIIHFSPEILSTPETMPPAVFGANGSHEENTDFIFHEIFSTKTHLISAPCLEGQHRWIAAGEGWVIPNPLRGFGSENFLLINPLTEEVIVLSRKILNRPDSTFQERCNFKKIIICRPPEHANGYFLVGLPYFEAGKIAFLRPGDDTWQHSSYSYKKRTSSGSPDECEDAILHNNHLYAITAEGNLYSFPLLGNQRLGQPSVFTARYLSGSDKADASKFQKTWYLVVSEGFLYTVTQIHGLVSTNRPSRIVIYRCQISDGHSIWEKVSDIGENAFFIGIGNSIAMSVSGMSSVKANAVYFMEPRDIRRILNGVSSNVTVYDMSRRSYMPFGYEPQVQYPAWLRPSFRKTNQM